MDYNNLALRAKRTDFTRNRAGLKFLIYDPFKNPERNKPNLYSWKANHNFRFKNLLPAVSLYGGVTFNLGDNPFYPEIPTITYRGMLATQSRLTPRFVLITNFAYDRITSDDPEMSYVVSITRALRDPKWSVFIENQGIFSDRYADVLLRTGIAYLFDEQMQADLNFGGSFKNTPSRFFFSMGYSYRFDFHKDKLVPIEDQEAGQNIKRKSAKNQGNDLENSKKEQKRKRKAEKKRKKQQKSSLEF
jgi:hypothetical protein